MIIIIVFCIASDLADRCVQTAEVATAVPRWTDAPCDVFVPLEIRPRLISCTKRKPGVPA